jgi:tetratricopeptide (TPR) repeat protein
MRAAARADNPSEQSDIRAVEGAELLAAGKMAEARTTLTAAYKGDVVTEMLLARALSATGDDAGALEHWDAVISRFGYGLEGQFDVQMAPAERAKVLERLGRTNEAIQALRALTRRYPVREGEPEPLALVEARARLRRYEQTPKPIEQR